MNRSFTIFLRIFLCLLIVMFAFFWYASFNQIDNIKKQQNDKLETLENKKASLIDISKVESTKSSYIFKKEDIKEINSNIDKLTNETFKEGNRAESIIDKDLDRLNLFMAVGIGFLALLGIFVPFLVNHLTITEFREEQRKLNQEQTGLKGRINGLDKNYNNLQSTIVKVTKLTEGLPSSEKLEEDSKKIKDLHSKVEELNPKISTINLQISINRLLNISSTILVQCNKNNEYKPFASLFERIKDEIADCAKSELKILLHPKFSEAIDDLISFLKDERFRFTSLIPLKKIDKLYVLLIEALQELQNENNKHSPSCVDESILKFENLITEILQLNNVKT